VTSACHWLLSWSILWIMIYLFLFTIHSCNNRIAGVSCYILIPFITAAKYSDFLNILKDRIGSLCMLNTYIYVDISGHCDVDPRFIFCNPYDGMRWWIWFLNLQVRWAHPAHEVSVLWSMLPGSCGCYSGLHSGSPVQRTFEFLWKLWLANFKFPWTWKTDSCFGPCEALSLPKFHMLGSALLNEEVRLVSGSPLIMRLTESRGVHWIVFVWTGLEGEFMLNLSVETVWNVSTWNSKKDLRLMFWSKVHGKGCRLRLSYMVLVFFSVSGFWSWNSVINPFSC
jgi:hypothetical protein